MLGITATENWQVFREGDSEFHEVQGYGVAFVVRGQQTAVELAEALEKATCEVAIEDVRDVRGD